MLFRSIRVPLKNLILKNGVWKVCEQWIRAIHYRLELALTSINTILAKSIKNQSKLNTLINQKKTIIYNELCAIGVHMALMEIERPMGRDILLQFAGYYELSNEKICLLLLEYEGAQSFQIQVEFSRKEIASIGFENYKRSIAKHENKEYYIISKCIGYINDLKTLRNILMINKLSNKYLQKRIYKKALLFPNIPSKIRHDI